MTHRALEIQRAEINYNLFDSDKNLNDSNSGILTKSHDGQNSNSVIRAVLEHSKIDVRSILTNDQYFNEFHGIETIFQSLLEARKEIA